MSPHFTETRSIPIRAGIAPVVALAAALLAPGCGSGSGASSTKTTADFAVTGISILPGTAWKINRPIDIEFNQTVDFTTVNANTINIVDETGKGATGAFAFLRAPDGTENRRVVRFQPACPTKADNSDAGLAPGGVHYLVHVLGSQSGGVTVRNSVGRPLEESHTVNFTTPDSDDAQELFLDTIPGPPGIRLRGANGLSSTEENATYLELGRDPNNRVYFELDISSQTGQLPAGFLLPLNHYSIVENQVAVMIHLDQPVVATEENISAERIVLEYEVGSSWVEMQTEVRLVANCIETGALVRVEPRGIVPQASAIRVNVKQGFSDLTGDLTQGDQTRFATMVSRQANNLGTVDPTVDADELLEGFDVGGDDDGSREDTVAALPVPRAIWADGRLQASFAFGGTGGPGGDFDWHLDPGTTVILNTTSFQIQGGPDGVPVTSQAVVNGVIDIDDLKIPESARLVVIGPNPCTILASGSVTVLGEISVRGSDSDGVGSLNTTVQPETGAKGNAGGGSGGTGSFLTSQSTPRGGRGHGAFEVSNGGGEGGESCYATGSQHNRRPGGGGGGVFGPDILFEFQSTLVRCQTLIGMDVEQGRGGSAMGTGAVSQTARAQGGLPGPSPFLDEFDDNDFFGTMIESPNTTDERLVQGELQDVHAGAGGGGGGDAVLSSSFPLVPFDPQGDEKGAGGGGGAGGLKILAIGPIVVGENGRIVADGGDGGGGENTIAAPATDRVGGGSGGGSGGHIILSSAAYIEIAGAARHNANLIPFWYQDNPTASLHEARSLSALGGQGGAGHNDRGGAGAGGPTLWRCDAVPPEHFDGFADLPPHSDGCWTGQPDSMDVLGPTLCAGGDGSPGIIQLHVDDPATNLRFPALQNMAGFPLYGAGLDVTPAMAPPALGWRSPTDAADHMVPLFGRLSVAQSEWIALGLARVNPGGPDDQVVLRFGGTDTTDGSVHKDGSTVDQLAAVIPAAPLGTIGTAPYIDADGLTLVFDASALTGMNELYKRNANLTRAFSVKLEEVGTPSNFELFSVASATYDDVADRLSCTVELGDVELDEFDPPEGVLASLVPHFFRVSTAGVVDSYPADTDIRIFFDATVADVEGKPSFASSFSQLQNNGKPTADISDLNGQNWDFYRFFVEFDLGEDVDLDTPRPALLFTRSPFEY